MPRSQVASLGDTGVILKVGMDNNAQTTERIGMIPKPLNEWELCPRLN